MPILHCKSPVLPPTGAPFSLTNILTQYGPTVNVEIGYDPDFFSTDINVQQQAIQRTSLSPSVQPVQLVPALIDTGALESCIDDELARALNLPVIDQISVSGVHGAAILNVYLGHIKIAELGKIQFGRFMGAKLSDGQQLHRALLGRTLFADMLLVYDGKLGIVSMSV
jgi:predicted aspartyl protease